LRIGRVLMKKHKPWETLKRRAAQAGLVAAEKEAV
jgi:hypothetical protein